MSEQHAVVAFKAADFKVVKANMKRAAAEASTRSEFLKMDRGGDWSYGQDETPVTEKDKVYVLPDGFVWGWQCWADTDIKGVQAEILGQVICGLDKPMPECPPNIPANGRPWAKMYGMSCIVNGVKLTYTTTSVGGVGSMGKFLDEHADHDEDDECQIAVLSLKSSWYKHKNTTFGKVYVPEFEIQGWVSEIPAPKGAAPKGAAPKKPALPKPVEKAPAPAKKVAPAKTPAKAAKKSV